MRGQTSRQSAGVARQGTPGVSISQPNIGDEQIVVDFLIVELRITGQAGLDDNNQLDFVYSHVPDLVIANLHP